MIDARRPDLIRASHRLTLRHRRFTIRVTNISLTTYGTSGSRTEDSEASSRNAPRADGTRPTTADQCARDVMEVVPVVMRVIRAEMRLRGGRFASVPQLRALGLAHRRPGASLTDVAVHLGVTPATASVLVDRLVRRGLLHRDSHPHERRRISLSLTRAGSQHLRDGADRHPAAARGDPGAPSRP